MPTMNRTGLTFAQRALPRALAVMAGVVAIVFAVFDTAVLWWAWGSIVLVPLGLCVAVLLAMALRAVRRGRSRGLPD